MRCEICGEKDCCGAELFPENEQLREIVTKMACALSQALEVLERGHCQNTREEIEDALRVYRGWASGV